MIIKGRIWIFGDNVDTDAIIPARYLSTSDPEKLAAHLMEDVDSQFAGRVKAGDLIVAGKNFGCGSSREHAPLAIKGAGVACVVAQSFARIFYRNAINIGLPILECPAELDELLAVGDEISVDLEQGLITDDRGRNYPAETFPPFMQRIIRDGGLIEHLRKRLGQPG